MGRDRANDYVNSYKLSRTIEFLTEKNHVKTFLKQWDYKVNFSLEDSTNLFPKMLGVLCVLSLGYFVT